MRDWGSKSLLAAVVACLALSWWLSEARWYVHAMFWVLILGAAWAGRAENRRLAMWDSRVKRTSDGGGP